MVMETRIGAVLDVQTYNAALAALAWQIELGADEAIGDAPIDRYAYTPPVEVEAAPVIAIVKQENAQPEPAQNLALALARTAVSNAQNLHELENIMREFDGCTLKRGARNLVFGAGHPAAHLMVIGNPPSKDEDANAVPFGGREGALLDKMLASIEHDRQKTTNENGAYLVPAYPWRLPPTQDVVQDDAAILRMFLIRHITLAAPRIVLVAGSFAAKILLPQAQNLASLRGTWQEVEGIPTIATFHPEALLRNPLNKRHAWEDLLAVQAKLRALK